MSYQTDQRHGAGRATSATVSIIVAILTLGYMLPWAIAANRGLRNSAGIFWLNLLTGWTLIGWVAALVMAALRHQIVPVPTYIPGVQPAAPLPEDRCVQCPADRLRRRLRLGAPGYPSAYCSTASGTMAEPAVRR